MIFNRVEISKDARDKFRVAALDGLLTRCGHREPTLGGGQYAGYTLVELARECLRQSNQKTSGPLHEILTRALTTSDFPGLLSGAANKSLFEGFETAPETWQIWCKTGSAPDFKLNILTKLSEASDLEEVPESAEYRYGKMTDDKETYQLATYGKIFAITRQAIINDDLEALSNIPQAHGEAAARKIGDVVYAVLTLNAALNDAIALFHASHANLAGSGAAPGVATIAAAILAMGTQKDLQALRRLDIRPQFFIAPKALEGVSEVFFRSNNFSDSNTIATDSSLASTRVNPYAGSYFSRVYDARLDDDSATAWYLAGPKGKTVKVFFLNGQQAPYLETKPGFYTDGLEFKVRIDAAATALDYRGLYKNPGA